MTVYRETRNGCTSARYHFIDGERVSNHDFSKAWLAALDRGEVTQAPTRTEGQGRVLIWESATYQIAPRYQLAIRKADDPESKWELRAHGARYGQGELAGVVAELESKGFAVIALALPAIELGRIVTARNSGGAWSAWHELQPQAYNVGGYLTEADAIAALHRYCGRPCDRDPVEWSAKAAKGLGNAANH